MIDCQALVIGAGFSGLAAAHRLDAAGVDVRVLEARDRVGGRTFTRYLHGGLQIDLGGQWFGPGQTRMYELAAQYGVKTFPLREVGERFAFLGGRRNAGPDAEVSAIYAELDRLARTVNLECPSLTPDAAELDAQTLHVWLADRTDAERAAYAARQLAGGLLAKDASQVSMLQVLFYLHSGGGVDSMLNTVGGAQQDRVIGGPFAIAQHMAEALAEPVVLGFDVASLTRETRGRRAATWTARARDGRELTADRMIVAVPPVVLDRIEISPAMPGTKRRAVRNILQGDAMKFHAVYATPLWNDQGRSGAFTSSTGLITEAVDNSVPGHAQGVLTFFVYGHDAARIRGLDAGARQELLLAEIADRLDDERLRRPVDFVEFDWDAEPHTGGCFSGSFAVGTMHVYRDALLAPWKGLRFAGTETADIWNGYFEGAVRAGEREAAALADELAAAP
ncbi:flavin monoamine oxidase family protein [Nonomuraea sp. NPDC049684]|uniref:flavin monoamine oxidase family protein n=1 Tax=Nonomuraea sp. NPDC049684 TaxID=3364356 RepID=UPI003798C26D